MNGRSETWNLVYTFERARQFWNSVLCCLFDHEVSLNAPKARAEQHYWLVTCERCGKPTRV